MKQIKTRERVKKHGEVFTAEREVNAMLDLVKDETEKIDSIFLEPACGNGNFLIKILERKLKVAKTGQEVLRCLASIYGIDIQEDNVIESRDRLKEMCKGRCNMEVAEKILEKNIIVGNFLEPDKVVMYKWEFDGNKIYMQKFNLGACIR